ncbi:MAG: hypothetical protein ACX930_01855 [Erythrobacter sp.]
MKNISKVTCTVVASMAVLGATPAFAQPDDLDPVAVAAAARYALPIAFDGFMRRCSASLLPDGYAKSNAGMIRAKFADGSDAAWPAAKAAMIQMSAAEGGEMSAMVEMMGDDALRPFVDGLVEGMVSQEIKPDDCESIERGLEILEPLPADNIAALLGFVVEMEQREKTEDDGEAR